MSIKLFLKNIARGIGYDVVQYVPDVTAPFDILSLVVEDRMKTAEGFFFLQIGANDGQLDDPLQHLVRVHRLSGLLVEPLPDLFGKLMRNYAGQAGLTFENVAIGPVPGKAPIFRVKPAADVPYDWHGLASFSRAHLLKEGVPEALIEANEVDCALMADLLDRHSLRKLDLLQVDTEGYGHEIVKSVLDAGVRPAIINYEHCHLVPRVRTQAKRMLVDNGYRFIETGKDTVAVLDGAA